ncbi:MAG: Lrp/AsnC ligand binding domain-containing protein [Nakamurella sp.]
MLNIEATRWAEIASELQGWPEVRACWSMAGDKDMAVLVDVSSNEDLMGLTERLNAMRTVRNTATHVVLRTHFDRGVAPP